MYTATSWPDPSPCPPSERQERAPAAPTLLRQRRSAWRRGLWGYIRNARHESAMPGGPRTSAARQGEGCSH
eukprot:14660038-Alexandrium_andersonii.AAC.1